MLCRPSHSARTTHCPPSRFCAAPQETLSALNEQTRSATGADAADGNGEDEADIDAEAYADILKQARTSLLLTCRPLFPEQLRAGGTGALAPRFSVGVSSATQTLASLSCTFALHAQLEALGKDGDIAGILERMMGQLLSKDVLYEPLKEISQRVRCCTSPTLFG